MNNTSKKKSKADFIYEDIRSKDGHIIEQLIEEFLNHEAKSVIIVKSLLDQCLNDELYNSKFSLMSQYIPNIRVDKLLNVKEQFGFFEFKKRKYFNKLLKDLEYI